VNDQPIILTADEVCTLLRLKKRTLERRHEWSPRFPAPLTRRPLTWLRSEVEAWIIRRNAAQQRQAA
jgi:predicted DNA-binding transcriptional regulator AlpA